MMKRLQRMPFAFAVLAVVLAGASNAQAQVHRVDSGRQSVGFNVGGFWVRGEDARADRTDGVDVLVADLSSAEALDFQVKDFNGATFGGEWLFAVSDYLEAGVGAGFYQRTVPSVYKDFQNANGSEIEQDLKMRMIPLSATVRFLPIGRGGVEPYVGGGIGVVNWRYSEVGDFVDTRDSSIFRHSYVAKGTTAGPVVLGGIRFPVADVWTVGVELRYQRAVGNIDTAETQLLGDKIDLGGLSASATFHLRF